MINIKKSFLLKSKEVLKHKINRNYRLATANKRVLPNTIIIGTQKAGTSSLYAYMEQHPQLFPSKHLDRYWSQDKEVHFFNGGNEPGEDNFAKGSRWYKAHFPLLQELGKSGQAFEATPLYMFNPTCAKRIYEMIPEVKLIVLLRNPVERTISNYFHQVRKERENLPILEALQSEEERLASSLDQLNYNSFELLYQSYKARSRYKEQLDRFFHYFSPEQFYITSSEEFFSRPEQILKEVFIFTGVQPEYKINNLQPKNVGTNRKKVEPEVYEYLENYFKPYNEELFELLGKKFNWK